MFDVLHKYSSQYSKSVFFMLNQLSINFLKVYISATFHHNTVVIILKKLFRYFFSYDFTIMTGDGNTNYIVPFIVSRLSAIIQLSISGLFIAMGKPIRNSYLGIVKYDWALIIY